MKKTVHVVRAYWPGGDMAGSALADIFGRPFTKKSAEAEAERQNRVSRRRREMNARGPHFDFRADSFVRENPGGGRPKTRLHREIAGVRLGPLKNSVVYVQGVSRFEAEPFLARGRFFTAPTRDGGFFRLRLFLHPAPGARGWNVSHEGFALSDHPAPTARHAVEAARRQAADSTRREWDERVRTRRIIFGLTSP